MGLRAVADRPDLGAVVEAAQDLQPALDLPSVGAAAVAAGEATQEQLFLAGLYGEFFEQGRAQGPTGRVQREEVTMKKTRRGRRGVLTKLTRSLRKYFEPPKKKKG